MFLLGLSNHPGTVNPFFLLLTALIIEAFVGRFAALRLSQAHPLTAIESTVRWLDIKLNRETRSNMDRASRGGLVVALVVLICAAIGGLVSWLTLSQPWGWIIELFLLVSLLGLGRATQELCRVNQHLQRNELDQARDAISQLIPTATAPSDEHAVARISIAWTAEQYATTGVGPTIWYALFGFPALMIFAGLRATSGIIGHRTERYRAFGFVAHRFFYILQFIPARLSGLFITFAATFVPTARPLVAVKIMLSDARRHVFVNSCWPIAALAGALELALAEPHGQRTDTPWLGNGRARATTQDIRRTIYLIGVAGLINICWVAVLAMNRIG